MFLTEGCTRFFHLGYVMGLKQLNHSPGLFKCDLEHREFLNYFLGNFKVTEYSKETSASALMCNQSVTWKYMQSLAQRTTESWKYQPAKLHRDKQWASLFLFAPWNLFLLYLTKSHHLSKLSSTKHLITFWRPHDSVFLLISKNSISVAKNLNLKVCDSWCFPELIFTNKNGCLRNT